MATLSLIICTILQLTAANYYGPRQYNYYNERAPNYGYQQGQPLHSGNQPYGPEPISIHIPRDAHIEIIEENEEPCEPFGGENYGPNFPQDQYQPSYQHNIQQQQSYQDPYFSQYSQQQRGPAYPQNNYQHYEPYPHPSRSYYDNQGYDQQQSNYQQHYQPQSSAPYSQNQPNYWTQQTQNVDNTQENDPRFPQNDYPAPQQVNYPPQQQVNYPQPQQQPADFVQTHSNPPNNIVQPSVGQQISPQPFATQPPQFSEPIPLQQTAPEQPVAVNQNDPWETRQLIDKSAADIETIYANANAELNQLDAAAAKKARDAKSEVGRAALEGQGLLFRDHLEKILETRDLEIDHSNGVKSLLRIFRIPQTRLFGPAVVKNSAANFLHPLGIANFNPTSNEGKKSIVEESKPQNTVFPSVIKPFTSLFGKVRDIFDNSNNLKESKITGPIDSSQKEEKNQKNGEHAQEENQTGAFTPIAEGNTKSETYTIENTLENTTAKADSIANFVNLLSSQTTTLMGSDSTPKEKDASDESLIGDLAKSGDSESNNLSSNSMPVGPPELKGKTSGKYVNDIKSKAENDIISEGFGSKEKSEATGVSNYLDFKTADNDNVHTYNSGELGKISKGSSSEDRGFGTTSEELLGGIPKGFEYSSDNDSNAPIGQLELTSHGLYNAENDIEKEKGNEFANTTEESFLSRSEEVEKSTMIDLPIIELKKPTMEERVEESTMSNPSNGFSTSHGEIIDTTTKKAELPVFSYNYTSTEASFLKNSDEDTRTLEETKTNTSQEVGSSVTKLMDQTVDVIDEGSENSRETAHQLTHFNHEIKPPSLASNDIDEVKEPVKFVDLITDDSNVKDGNLEMILYPSAASNERLSTSSTKNYVTELTPLFMQSATEPSDMLPDENVVEKTVNTNGGIDSNEIDSDTEQDNEITMPFTEEHQEPFLSLPVENILADYEGMDSTEIDNDTEQVNQITMPFTEEQQKPILSLPVENIVAGYEGKDSTEIDNDAEEDNQITMPFTEEHQKPFLSLPVENIVAGYEGRDSTEIDNDAEEDRQIAMSSIEDRKEPILEDWSDVSPIVNEATTLIFTSSSDTSKNDEENKEDLEIKPATNQDDFNDCLLESDQRLKAKASENQDAGNKCINNAVASGNNDRQAAKLDLQTSYDSSKGRNEAAAERLQMCSSSQFELCVEERQELQSTVDNARISASNIVASANDANSKQSDALAVCSSTNNAYTAALRQESDQAFEYCKRQQGL